ncbi:MAG TPA: helix-turn-helix domain-containing protein [bacterium]|nr:helix-turn-helix domain-containing protein [bacterium]
MEHRPVMELRRAFGSRVHEARQAAHISQAQLAARLGLRSGVAVGDWERGKALPKFETFMRLCEALNQSPAYFIEGYRERPAKGRIESIQDAVDSLEAKAGQRHLELLHRMEHLPVEIGRSIAPEELRAALERLRCEDLAATGEARPGAAARHHGGRDDAASVAQEAFREGWEAAHEAVRQWLHQRGRAV